MTLGEAKSLVDRLAAKLGSPVPSSSDQSLASEYAAACADVNARLAQCARMVEGGSSLQALMIAEEKPGLMDMVAVLGFARQAEWIAFCQENGLTVPEKASKGAVRLLNDLYNSGSRAEQTKALYRDFRGAMATKDEARALDVIRTISQLDPTDKDAAEQVARLERRVQESALQGLDASLAANDEGRVLRWLARCENLQVTEGESLAQARQIRARQQAREAEIQIHGIVAELVDYREKANWQQCGERASRVHTLAATHGLTLSAADYATVNEALQYFEACRAEALRKARFKESINAISGCVERQQAARFEGVKSSLASLEGDALELRKIYETAASFGLPIPEGLTEKVAQLASSLDSQIAQARKMRRIRNVATMAAASLALIVVAWAGYMLFRANAFKGEIAAMRERTAAVPLERLLAEIRANQAILLKLPSLSSAVLEAEQWLKSVASKKAVAVAALGSAQALAESEFSQVTPEQAATIFQQASAALDALPADIADPLRVDLAKAEKELALWLPQQRDEKAVAARKILVELRPLAEDLSPSKPPEVLEETLAKIAPLIEQLKPSLDTQVSEMALPAALQEEVKATLDKVKAVSDLLAQYRKAREQVAAATDLSGYSNALEALAKVGLPKSREVQAAQQASNWKLSDHSVLGQLILPQAAEAWELIKTPDDLKKLPFPDTPRQAETDRLLALIRDKDIADVSEARVATSQAILSGRPESGRLIYFRGKPTVSKPSGYGSSDEVWTGLLYDPSRSPGTAVFSEASFRFGTSPTGVVTGEAVREAKPSPAAKALAAMKLNQWVSPDGDKFRQSIFPMLERVRMAADAPALMQAYAIQQMMQIAQLRPTAWGLAWAPALPRIVDAIRAAASGPINAGDWMVPRRQAEAKSIEQILLGDKSISFEKQAQLHRQLAAAALQAGVVYCGFVDATGARVASGGTVPEECSVLWGFAPDSSNLVALFRRGSSGDFEPAGSATPLTPLLTVRSAGAPNTLEAMRALGIEEDQVPAYAKDLPPLFREGFSTKPSE